MNESRVQQLHKKHPKVGDLYDDMVLQGPVKYVDPIIFEAINSRLIQQISLKTKG